MPEKPEVITVAKKLKLKLAGKKILKTKVLWPNIPEGITPKEFEEKLVNQTILDITTRGKWLIFHISDWLLLVHLRMEGKFFFRNINDPIGKHEHVIFTLDSGEELRFADVRKFGKMRLLPKVGYEALEPFSSLGLEVWDEKLDTTYLLECFKKKSLPIKTTILDQSIITGIGNIYADEILFLSRLNPLMKTSSLTEGDCQNIIVNAVRVLDKAIEEGGTTIRSYTSEEGVTGLFQNSLNVHAKEGEKCPVCSSVILKIKVGGRGTYYCPKCQK